MPPGNHCVLNSRGGAWEQGYIYIVTKTEITESSIVTLGPPPSTSVKDQGEMNEKCYTECDTSLIPRLFPPPVFDRLQYANTEGEGLGDLVTCGYVR